MLGRRWVISHMEGCDHLPHNLSTRLIAIWKRQGLLSQLGLVYPEVSLGLIWLDFLFPFSSDSVADLWTFRICLTKAAFSHTMILAPTERRILPDSSSGRRSCHGFASHYSPLQTHLLLVLRSTELRMHSKYAEMVFTEYNIKKRRLTSLLSVHATAEIC